MGRRAPACTTECTTMPVLTFTEAARLAGVDRSTIRRQAKRGVISVSHRSDGSRGIDAAELCRVYPGALPQGNVGQVPQPAPVQSGAEAVALLHAQLEAARAHIEELRRDKIWLQEQVDHLQQRLLPPPRKPFLDRFADAIQRMRKKPLAE